MIIVYTPRDGGEEQQFDFADLLTSEASIAQRTIDRDYDGLRAGVGAKDPEVLRVVGWILKKRHEATLRFKDFDPYVTELDGKFDKRETRAYIDQAFQIVDSSEEEVTEEEVSQAMQMCIEQAADKDHARQLIADVTAAREARDEDPKADVPEPEPSSPQQSEPQPEQLAEDPIPMPTSSEPAPSTSASSLTS